MFNNIQLVERLIIGMGCEIDWVVEDIISVDYGLWYIIIYEDDPCNIYLNLHVDICPWKAADIAKRLSYLASMIGINLVIDDVYAYEFDEDGKKSRMTFGPDAYKTAGRKHFFGIYR